MKFKKIYTNKIGKKTYFELSYPSYADVQEREAEARTLRSVAQSYRLDLQILNSKIEAEEDIIYKLISNREEDWEEEVESSRAKISALRSEYIEKEAEGTGYVEEFQLEWVCRHLKTWSYADSEGGFGGKSNGSLPEPLPLPADVEELKALELDQRIVNALINEVQKLYDDEDEKND